jgi:predicted  nucleic acid-binding Zn-ribbon protein
MTFLGEPDSIVSGGVYLVRDNVIWGGLQFSYPTYMGIMIPLPIPASLPAGDYLLQFMNVSVAGEDNGQPMEPLALTVTDTLTPQEAVEGLEQQVLALQTDLVNARAELRQQTLALQALLEETLGDLGEVNDNMSALQASLDLLEAQVVLMEAGLEQANVQAQVANASLALLHERLQLTDGQVGGNNESLAQLRTAVADLAVLMQEVQGQLEEARGAIEEVEASLNSTEGADLRTRMDGKMDVSLGYLILVAVLIGIAANAVLMAVLLRKRQG